ncbi:MAG TPA: hemerythrin domain-containing protein [Polyangiaceae bacterium]
MSRDSHLPTLFGRATLVSDGHTTLRDSVRVLRGVCEDGASPDAHPDSDLSALLETFAEGVLSHFELEEAGAYFGTLAEDSPELLDQIAELKSEHGSMRISLGVLRQPEGPPSSAEFLGELRSFLDRFESHEQHESRVLERFFLKEGSGTE